MNSESNYPAGQLKRTEGTTFCKETVDSIKALSQKGKPQTVEELQERIDDFFCFCSSSSLRPGVESLSLALSVDRTTFWRWCQPDCGKGEAWVAICQKAKQAIIVYLEQASLSGRLNPASAIFLLKNLASYRDTISFEDASIGTVEQKPQSNLEMAAKMGLLVTSGEASIMDESNE